MTGKRRDDGTPRERPPAEVPPAEVARRELESLRRRRQNWEDEARLPKR
jgi:hypothetical protein